MTWQELHRKVQNRVTYYKIIARKRGVKLSRKVLKRLEYVALRKVDGSLNALFEYEYGPKLTSGMLLTSSLLNMIPKAEMWSGGPIAIPSVLTKK